MYNLYVFCFRASSKIRNTKVSQFEIMVNYMTQHPDLSKGYLKTPGVRQKSRHLWTNLSIDLNAEGPPQRDAEGWKKVWADFKVHTKAKLRKNKINLSGTGGGPPKHHPLTPLEEKVSELLDLGEAIDGMNGSLSFGLQDTSMSCSQDHEEAEMFEVIAETQTNDNISQKVNLPHPRKTPKKKTVAPREAS
ncbi:uncharacterized protein LOC129952105 isoform X1 [Eupeodes corollae]|uniref:uncharacterized protein LOC129952105 isoform X1 n=1 Tax=Eupeodes corollae TaxID=290404 RepID=UPI002493B214|nr:uncharacterized protein LOC129952105 isoform X1 [Eupeodes corollae]